MGESSRPVRLLLEYSQDSYVLGDKIAIRCGSSFPRAARVNLGSLERPREGNRSSRNPMVDGEEPLTEARVVTPGPR